jgi:hypothetical protein
VSEASEKDEAMRDLNVALLKPGKYSPLAYGRASLNDTASIKAQGSCNRSGAPA